MVRLTVPVALPVALVAAISTENSPETAGVPEMSPLVASSANPSGSPLAEKLVGWFAARIRYSKCSATLAKAVAALSMTGCGGVGIVALTSADGGPSPATLTAETT
jgi:hypothetical protein